MKDSKHILVSILRSVAPEFGVDADNISVVANGKIEGKFTVGRYTIDSQPRFLITFGRQFVALDTPLAMLDMIRSACGALKTAKELKVEKPVVLVQDSEFDYEYVVRAKHLSGVICTRISNRPEFLSMKESIHQETATVISMIAKGRI